MELEFEWHFAKAESNLQTHGISFELAKTVFKDPFAIELLDDREDYGEERFVIMGMAEGHVLLFVAYTERHERIRIISARRVTQYEQDEYFRQNA
ncbi:MAG TPA: BrnT family toxin [Bryobacteraceae bacterium]|nr:BrnT family toxin [Bryobacteraceae bacterium]